MLRIKGQPYRSDSIGDLLYSEIEDLKEISICLLYTSDAADE